MPLTPATKTPLTCAAQKITMALNSRPAEAAPSTVHSDGVRWPLSQGSKIQDCLLLINL